MHSSPLARHSSFQKTFACSKHSFFCEGMKKDNLTLVSEYDTFQWNKGETIKNPGPLQPLPIPPTPWIYNSMEFIVGLSKMVTNHSSWWWLINYLNMLSFVLSTTLSHQHLLLKSFWSIFLNYLACLPPLHLIITPLSPVNFGKNYLSHKEHM